MNFNCTSCNRYLCIKCGSRHENFKEKFLVVIDYCEIPQVCCSKFKMWMFYLFMIILLSPFTVYMYMYVYSVIKYFRFIGNPFLLSPSWCKKILYFPVNVMIFIFFIIGLQISLILGVALGFLLLPVFWYKNTLQFKLVMGYWSWVNISLFL